MSTNFDSFLIRVDQRHVRWVHSRCVAHSSHPQVHCAMSLDDPEGSSEEIGMRYISVASTPYCPCPECRIPPSCSPLYPSRLHSPFHRHHCPRWPWRSICVAPTPSSFHYLFHRFILPRRHLRLRTRVRATRTLARFCPGHRNCCYGWHPLAGEEASIGVGGRDLCAVLVLCVGGQGCVHHLDRLIIILRATHFPSVHTQKSFFHRPGTYQSSFLVNLEVR